MAQLHRLDDAVDDHGGAEAGSQSQKEHLSALIATQGLHGRVVDDLDRAAERGVEVESNPAGPQVMRFRNRLTSKNRARVADRYGLKIPALGRLPNAGDHLRGRHGGPGDKLARSLLARCQNLDV